ncbi:MAG: hypothetical protein KC503_00945 [Myxococcales bacterium]|nr:hypothetical protein [Myxococcales bacterium]
MVACSGIRFPRARTLALLFGALVSVGCSSASSELSDAARDVGARDARAADGARDAATDDGSDAAIVAPITVQLTVTGSGSEVARLYVPVRYQGASALMLLDTGAATSFLHLGVGGPAWDPNAGSIDVDGRPFAIGGRNFDPYVEGNLDVVGTMGADFLLRAASELDLRCGTLTLHPGGLPPSVSFKTHGFDNVQGHVIVPLALAGEPLRLMLDTGAQHTVWLGKQPDAGDTPVTTKDALGNDLTFYLAQAALTLGPDGTRDVPILKAPSFPYFEQTVKQLGGNIHGLLGLSALKGRVVTFESSPPQLRLEPLDSTRSCP